MGDDVRHPVFARVYDRLSARAEEAGQDAHRRELLAGLRGRVIEIGAGNGLNFKHYPATVAKVVAVEPAQAVLLAEVREVRGDGARARAGAIGAPASSSRRAALEMKRDALRVARAVPMAAQRAVLVMPRIVIRASASKRSVRAGFGRAW